jgi:TRAP-type C4-dicarboxylate transport system substrate-binding protein
MSSFAPSGLHFAREAKTLDNLRGLKIIAGSKTTAQFAARLGAAPLTLPVSEAYSAMQRGTADALSQPWTTFPIFKYDEVTQYHVPNASLGTAVGVVFMSIKKYDGLPEAARHVIDANRGEKQSREMGAFWDVLNEEGRKYTMARPNHTIAELNPDQLTAWHRQAEIVATEWAKTVPDGERLLVTYRDILAKVQTEDRDSVGR